MSKQFKREVVPVFCGTCGKEDIFYKPVQVDLTDADLKTKEELEAKMKEQAKDRPEAPFIKDLVDGDDNCVYIVHYCDEACMKASPPTSKIEHKTLFISLSEPEDFQVMM